MSGPIPWERYSGETIEGILATYISRLHPFTTRIRPSRGDRGIDLMEKHPDGTVTVYQIKKFASNLDTSQKRQIKESLDTLLRYLESTGYELRAWHLVMPLDPTIENLEWFNGLVSDPCYDMVWDGLARIDGWAAQMPEVADYCLNANREWVTDIVRLHLEALDLEGDGGRDRVVQRLLAVQEVLEKTAPYYRYGIHLLPKSMGDMDVKRLMETSEHQPGLLMTQMIEQPGVGLIQIDVFARSAALAELHPIRGSLTFTPRDEDERRQVEDFVNYGVPIRSCTARIVETSGLLAVDMSEVDGEGVLSMLPNEAEPIAPELYLTTKEGCELALFRTSRTSGEKGVQSEYSDEAGVVSMTLRVDVEGGITGIPQISTKGIERKDCSAVRDSLCFLHAAYECGEMSILFDNEVLAVWALHPNGDLTRSIDALYELASAVVAIGKRVHVQLPFPEICSITESQHAAMLSMGKLAEGKCVVRRWRDAPFKMVAYEEMSLEFPVIVKWLRPEKITISGIECNLGYSENIIVAGSLLQDVGDEAFTFLPHDAEEDVCVTHLLPTRSAAAGMVNQVYTTPYQDDAWANTLRFAGYNKIDAS